MSQPAAADAGLRVALNAALLDSSATYRSTGVSQYLRRTLRGLAQAAREDPALWCLQAFASPRAEAMAGIQFRAVGRPFARSLQRIAWEQGRLPGLLARTAPRLFHGLVNVLPLRCPCPSVVTVLDLSFERAPETVPYARRQYLRVLCRRSVAQAARVVAISQATADDLTRWYRTPADKITVVPVPVAPDFTPAAQAGDAAALARLGVPARFFLHVGTLEPRKNLGWLIETFAAWRAEGQARRAGAEDVGLVLAGPAGWEKKDFLARLRTLGLAARVFALGFVPRASLAALYRAALACVFPSRLEGFGMPLLEALACGALALCNDLAVFREVAQGHALFFDARRRAELQHLLTVAAQDPQTAQALRPGGLAHAAQFSELAAGRALLNVYRKVL